MRVVNAKDMHALPEGTIYCGVTNDGPMPGGFHGYSENLYRIGVRDTPGPGWWAAELLPQPFVIDEATGERRLRVRAHVYMWREPPNPEDHAEEYYHVFDRLDVAVLVCALGGVPRE